MIKSGVIKGEIVYDILNFEYEDEMDTICKILATKYPLSIIEKLEGPGTTLWKLKISDNDFSLVNDNWGNFLRPKNDNAINFIEQEMDVINRLFP